MSDSDAKEISLEFICKHKDPNPSNLNTVFESYGCTTLEAKIPVVTNPVVAKLNEISPEQKLYATLALKSESAYMALEGRRARTRNRPLSVVDIGRDEKVIAAGNVRERSPVDEDVLDTELDDYMKQGALMKAKSAQGGSMDVDGEGQVEQGVENVRGPSIPQVKVEHLGRVENKSQTRDVRARFLRATSGNSAPSAAARKKKEKLPEDLPEVLDEELEAYMREAARKRNRKKMTEQMSEQIEREKIASAMEEMECFNTNIGLTPVHDGNEDDDL